MPKSEPKWQRLLLRNSLSLLLLIQHLKNRPVLLQPPKLVEANGSRERCGSVPERVAVEAVAAGKIDKYVDTLGSTH